MAGNVKEWCWNQADDRRYILGGAWGEPSYMFANPDAQAPFRRLATYGFRCAKYPRPLSDALSAAVGALSRDYSGEKPASDETFRLYEHIYSYDRTPLSAVTEAADDTPEHWRTEKISFDAAYGSERVTANLFLPRNAVPPYQTVVFFPGGYASRSRSSENLSTQFLEFILRSGHAVLYPIYKGSYERGGGLPLSGPGAERDMQIQQSRDLGRSIDYLETRRDIDRERLAYYGLSAGAVLGPIFMALEPRLKASILLSGGFPPYSLPPEADPINFAPRAKVPALMVNGRQDFALPLEASQEPMFRLLGAPQEDKRRVVFDDSGHFPNPNRVGRLMRGRRAGAGDEGRWSPGGDGVSVCLRPTGPHASPDRSDKEHVAATALLPTQAQPGTTKALLLALRLVWIRRPLLCLGCLGGVRPLPGASYESVGPRPAAAS